MCVRVCERLESTLEFEFEFSQTNFNALHCVGPAQCAAITLEQSGGAHDSTNKNTNNNEINMPLKCFKHLMCKL